MVKRYLLVVEFATLIGCLTLAAPSSALTTSPAAAERGQILPLTVYTPGFNWTDGVIVRLGAGVAVLSVHVVAPELLQVEVAVSFTADPGPRDVEVEQGAVVVVSPGTFRVMGAGVTGEPGGPPVAFNAIVNPGFEAGNLNGWIPSTWSISTILPHGGAYDAYDPGATGGGGGCIRQNFMPAIDSDNITTFNFWLRQPDNGGIAQVIVFHQNAGQQVGVAFTNDDDSWTFENFTSLVVPNDFVTGIHVCGFGGGQPTPDDSWVDDFVLEVTGATALEPTTWGRIKAALR